MFTLRVPPVGTAHSATCTDESCRSKQTADDVVADVVKATNRTQRQVTGYTTDYQNKKHKFVKKELAKCKEGHNALLREVNGKKPKKSNDYHSWRHITRLLTNLHGRATVRKAAECAHLVVYSKPNDPTAAEMMRSVAHAVLDVRQFERECFSSCTPARVVIGETKDAHGRVMKPKLQNYVARAYGHRVMQPPLDEQCPYSFVYGFQIEEVAWPRTLAADDKERAGNELTRRHHCRLTPAGRVKLDEGDKELQPGVDYTLFGDSGVCFGQRWWALQESSPLRHVVVIIRRHRPRVPVFRNGYPLQRDVSYEQQAKQLSMLFRSWVSFVPYAGYVHSLSPVMYPLKAKLADLSGKYAPEWQKYITNGVPTMWLQHMITNFRDVFGARTGEDLEEAVQESDDGAARLDLGHGAFFDLIGTSESRMREQHSIPKQRKHKVHRLSVKPFVPTEAWRRIFAKMGTRSSTARTRPNRTQTGQATATQPASVGARCVRGNTHVDVASTVAAWLKEFDAAITEADIGKQVVATGKGGTIKVGAEMRTVQWEGRQKVKCKGSIISVQAEIGGAIEVMQVTGETATFLNPRDAQAVDEQRRVLELLGKQIVEEAKALDEGRCADCEPLLLFVTGAAGTGQNIICETISL